MSDGAGRAGMISVIIPCYQEEHFIFACLASVRSFEVPAGHELEVLVVDGGSRDRTRELVSEVVAVDRRVRLLDNPRRTQSAGLNIGIAASHGEYILRLDAHSTYPADYVTQCLDTSKRIGADNVGGLAVTNPSGSGYQAELTRALTTHRFGVGASFRTGVREGRADTVPYGFFRRDVFDRFGLFDERLARAQDYEFNRRIVNRGGTVWLNPSILVHYFQQPTLRRFLSKQFFLDAPYNAYMWYLAPYTFTPRHAITAVFALGVLLGIPLAFVSPIIAVVVTVVFGAYGVLALLASAQQAVRYRQSGHFVVLPFCFLAYHLTHGLGVLTGVLRIMTGTAPVRRRDRPWVALPPAAVPVGPPPEPVLVSVLIPTWQEEHFVVGCLESVRSFRLPAGVTIEVLVIDGGSTDATRELVQRVARRDPRIMLMHNPARIQSVALNLGIRESKGDYIMRLDAHSTYPPNYLEKCLETARRTRCENVGGIFETQARGPTYHASLVQALTTHWFGVGRSFRTKDAEGPADTVAYGFFRRDTFERFGLFDERLVRAEDYELNRRIAARGGRVWLNPEIVVEYSQQPTLQDFLRKQFYVDAPYNAYMWHLAPYTFTTRHAASALFTMGLIAGIPLMFVSSLMATITTTALGLYAVLAVLASIQQARRYGKWRHAVLLPPSFVAYHLTHGAGVLVGMLRILLGNQPTKKNDPPWRGAVLQAVPR